MYLYSSSISFGADNDPAIISIYGTYDAVSARLQQSALERALADRNGETLNSLPILMYHNFYDSSAGQRGRDANWMDISDFELQMRYLSESNYFFPSWEEVHAFVNGGLQLPIRSVVITIDDGDSSFFDLALPVLQKYNIRATSFVVTSWMTGDIVAAYGSDMLHFESHSHDMHRPGRNEKGAIVTATADEIYNDLVISREVLNGRNRILLSIWTL